MPPHLRLRPASLALVLSLVFPSAIPTAWSQATLPAAAQTPVSIEIPGQPLAQALNQWAQQTRLEFIVEPALVAGKSAPAVSGSMTPQQALERLLAGSGLEATADGATMVIKRPLPTTGSEQQLPEVKVVSEVEVHGRYQSASHELPPEYPGGQVARGGKLGVFGNKDMMDTPFNQSAYTSKLMQDQQARFIADVLDNDPSARTTASASGAGDAFNIRGFEVSNADVLFNGLVGVTPTYFDSMMAESVERVEVLKGPNALLNGAADGVGGAINVVPKRAGDQPLSRFTLGYVSDSQLGGHLDVGRRLGSDKQFGIRFNGVYRDGDTAIDHQSRESRLMSLGLDYRGERLRLRSDLGYQYQHTEGARRILWLGNGLKVPKAPDSRVNFYGPAFFLNPQVYYGTLGGEIDFSPKITAFATVGGYQRTQRSQVDGRTIVDVQGTLEAGVGTLSAMKLYSKSFETGLRGRFETGAVQHEWTLAYSTYDLIRKSVDGDTVPLPESNIYAPIYGPVVNKSLAPDPDDAQKTSDTTFSGITLADTLSFAEGRLQLALGARLQKIKIENFDTATGAVTSEYAEDRVTPLLGLVIKPWQRWSLYANYIEGLQQGPVAPDGTANAGEIFAPLATKQYEIGAKVDLDRLSATLALYQITQPSGITDPITSIFSVDGEQRHRGIDLNVFGEVARSVRILGGAAYIDSELTRTEGGNNDGNRGTGVPKLRIVLGIEWDTPFLGGLTLTGRVIRNGPTYVDSANTQEVPGWTRVDLGARYQLNKTVIIRANLNNALDKNYWESTSLLSLSDPRTFSLSASIGF